MISYKYEEKTQKQKSGNAEQDVFSNDVVWRLIEAEQNIKSKRAQALCQNLVRSS
jgi:hypothetical protein